MAKRTTPSASFVGRPVESFRGSWVPLEDAFHDPGVARDFVRHLEPRWGPTIARCSVTGGSKQFKRVVGDWLCDDLPGSIGNNVRLPEFTWDYDSESEAWAENIPLPEAWETCVDARWSLYAATDAGVDLRSIVIASCACARAVLHLVPGANEAGARAIETAEAWARGEATQVETEEASHQAMRQATWFGIADVNAPLEEAISARALASAGFAASMSRQQSPAGVYASGAAENAADALRLSGDGDAAIELATSVRAHITTLIFLRAVARSSPKRARRL